MVSNPSAFLTPLNLILITGFSGIISGLHITITSFLKSSLILFEISSSLSICLSIKAFLFNSNLNNQEDDLKL